MVTKYTNLHMMTKMRSILKKTTLKQ